MEDRDDLVEADVPGRWKHLDRLLLRPGNITGPEFEPCPEIRDALKSGMKILVVGAGGLGCELLKDLALSGFGHIEVIDMDTIDVSNLNRQFLFRMHDVGKSKANVAAERIMERVKGVTVIPHFCRIEEKDISFYKDFSIVVLGLDSLEARSYINSVICSFLEYDVDGAPVPESIKPMVDGGTEGFKGHARVIVPGMTPCFQCTLWLFPPQVKFPLCTLAETPRSPAHCIEYAKLILWDKERPGETFDPDDPDHMTWVYKKALERSQQYSIQGVTYSLTQGVVKNIIPAIASTNAIVAAACALETLKIATVCSAGMNNYMMYVGTEAVYTHTVQYEKDASCSACGAGIPLTIPADTTLQQVLDLLIADKRVDGKLVRPSVAHNGTNLYMQAPPVLEEMTRPNLSQALLSLTGGDMRGVVLNVNDKKLTGLLRVRVSFAEEGGSAALTNDMDMTGGG